jgi:hypothetical protein
VGGFVSGSWLGRTKDRVLSTGGAGVGSVGIAFIGIFGLRCRWLSELRGCDYVCIGGMLEMNVVGGEIMLCGINQL